MTVHVRPLAPDDDVTAFGDPYGPDTDEPRRRRTVVAVDDGVVVGIATAWWSTRHIDLVLGNGHVLATHRRRGVGGALLHALRDLAGSWLEFVITDDAPDNAATRAFLRRAGFSVALESWTVRVPLAAAPLGPDPDVRVATVPMDDEVEAFFERIYAERHAWAGRYVSTPGRPWIRFAGAPVEGSVSVVRRNGEIVAAACLTTGEFADGADAFLPPTGTTLNPLDVESTEVMRAVVHTALAHGVALGFTAVNVEYDTPYVELSTVMGGLRSTPVHHAEIWM